MNKLDTILIETDRLILRPLKVDDAVEMFNNWASDELATMYMPWDRHTEISVTIEYLKMLEEQYKTEKIYNWGIVIKEENILIGTITFVGLSERHRVAEIGYIIGSNWWGNGYVVEAGKALLNYGFHKLGLNRIQAIYHVENTSSGRVLEKLGMKYEGTMRECRLVKGEFISVKQYSILKNEYVDDSK